jgi:hypothetical protein
MKRQISWPLIAALIAVMGILAACGTAITREEPTESPASSLALQPPTLTALPSPTPTATVEPLAMPTPEPSFFAASPTPSIPWLTGEVRAYPGPRHYVGDVLSFEVVAHGFTGASNLSGITLRVDGQELPADPRFATSTLRGDVIVFNNVWDTTGVEPGDHAVSISLPEGSRGGGRAADVMIRLEPAEEQPLQERDAVWYERSTNCCRVYYLSGTTAEREIIRLGDELDQAFAAAEERLGLEVEEGPATVALIDNVWGNGAYINSDDMVISVVDRRYVGTDLTTMLAHEAVHWITQSCTARRTPAVVCEGLAVYGSGGHYSPEPLRQRGAALVTLDIYIPLETLAGDFRGQQHEAAYVEAGALVQFLVSQYGIERFLSINNTGDIPAGSDAEWLDEAFRRTYDADLAEIEKAFQAWLGGVDPGEQTADLAQTIALFESIRRYQTLYAAYQESLPPIEAAVTNGTVSEFIREPHTAPNVAIETMYVAAQEALLAGDYRRVATLVDAVNATLDDGDFTRAPVGDYLAITNVTAAAGYEAQRIDVDGVTATVEAVQVWPQLETLNLVKDEEGWHLAE